MRKVTVYTTETCATCVSVQNLLDAREIPYEEVVLVEHSHDYKQLLERTGMSTLPQVHVGPILIGGYIETLYADQSGMLSDLLVD